MKIEDLKNRRVRISKNSITCKDDDDKTRGVVRGITKWNDWQFNKQFETSQMISKAGLWGNGLSKNVVVCGNKLYYLYDKREQESYEKSIALFGDDNGYKKRKLQELMETRERAPKSGIEVVECYIIGG